MTTTDDVLGKTAQTNYTYLPFFPGYPPYDYNSVASSIPLESTIQYYDWGNTSSSIRTVTKAWYNQFDLATEQTTLDNGQTSKITYCYVGSNCVPPPGTISQVYEKDEYDFGQSTPSRKTITNYQSFANSLVPIVDFPCQIIVEDGSGNRMAETDYLYDGGTTVCGTPGTPSVSPVSGLVSGTHDEVNFAPSSTTSRGNLTQKIVWSNTGTSPATTYTYDETGEVTSSTDPCGNGTCSDMTGANHTTLYYYNDSYTVLSGGQNVGYTPSGNTDAYLTKITDPLGHIETFSYDFNNGQLTKSTDANGQSTGLSTTYLYNDPFARPTLVNYPDGGQTAYAYNDSPYNPLTPSPSVTTTRAITAGVNEVSTAAFDGLG